MILANRNSKETPWFAKAGAACSIVPIVRFIGPGVFALKGGGYGCLFSLTGIDEEGHTDEELELLVNSIEGALYALPENSCLYQYTRVRKGFEIPRQRSYANPVTEKFVNDRLSFLDETAGFRKIDLHWALIVEPSKSLLGKPKENAATNARLINSLQKAAAILESHLSRLIGLKLLGNDSAFQFFSYLFNLTDWAERRELESDFGIDRQIVASPIAWQDDYIKVGKRFVQMFSLAAEPKASRPCLFQELQRLDCDSILCTIWKRKSSGDARKEVESQEKFIEFFKHNVLEYFVTGHKKEQLNETASARAASDKVTGLSEVLTSLNKKAQGHYSLCLLLNADNREELEEVTPEVHRIFVEARAKVIEETIGNLSSFYSMFPGNSRFSVYSLWLREDHNARLASVFAPHIGHPHSEDLDNEYLNVFETRTGTPFFQDVYVNGVRVMLIVGSPGVGKSVHANQMLALEPKYDGFTYIFDIGGSYESQVQLYGGRIERIGLDGPRINIFSLEPTEANLKRLYSFTKLLLTNGGADLEPEDDDIIFDAVKGIYLLDRENRRLGNLYLPKKLDRYLRKWIGNGVYGNIFDNVEDSLTLSRRQCFDFQRVIDKQFSDLIEPLMVWSLWRIDDVLYDPRNLGVPKHVLIEELFANMHNEKLLESALNSIKMARKNLGGVTLIGQSAEDLGPHAKLIVNSCSTFLFLPDETFNRKDYAELFKLNSQQLDLYESLQEREGLYVRRDGLTKVVRLNLDPASYAAFSTKPKDRIRREKLVQQYGLSEGLARFARGEVA